jgi:hypothetical protein
MDFDVRVKLAIYQHFATTGERPSPEKIASQVGAEIDQVLESYNHLRAQRVLVLEEDGMSICMAPPFSGVPTQHIVECDGVHYHANCAWDALGVAAALGKPATIHSRCEGSREPLRLKIGLDGPEPSDWIFHSLVPAAQWWDDIVFT